MSSKTYMAIGAAVAAVVAAVALCLVLAPGQQGQAERDVPKLTTAQPVTSPVQPAVEPEPEDGPEAAGPAPCTFDAAYGIARGITGGTYDFTQEGWERLERDAGAVSLAVDEASVKAPFVQYEARTMAAMKVFASLNDDSSFVKTGPSSWKLTLSVRRAASPIGHDDMDTVRSNLKRKLKSDGDSPEFRAQVTYDLVIDGDEGRLTCTSPEWYL